MARKMLVLNRLLLMIIFLLVIDFAASTAQTTTLPLARERINEANAADLDLLAALEAHSGTAYSLAFHPRGSTLLSGGEDGSVRLWDIRTGQVLRAFEGQEAPVHAVAYSLDGQLVAAGSDWRHDPLIVWNAASGKEVTRFQVEADLAGLLGTFIEDNNTGVINAIAFDDDGSIVSAIGEAGLYIRWRVQRSRYEEVSFGRNEYLDLAYNPVRQLNAYTDGSTVTIIDLSIKFPGQGYTKHFIEQEAILTALEISPDGNLLYAGTENGSIIIWDISDFYFIKQFRSAEGQPGSISGLSISADGDLLISSTLGGNVQLWNAQTLESLTILTNRPDTEILDVAFSPDSTLIAASTGDGHILLWGKAAPPGSTPIAPLTCNVTAQSNANLRAGPATTFDIVGRVAANTAFEIDGKVTVDSTFTWYRLVDGGWIRNDLVIEVPECDVLMEVVP